LRIIPFEIVVESRNKNCNL